MSFNNYKIVYSPKYEVDIGYHVFPTDKYRLVREYLISKEVVAKGGFICPEAAEMDTVKKIHTVEYVDNIANGTLSYADEIRLELPYSKELAEAAFLCCGGTILACRQALETGLGIHLGGGFHHAYADHGEGFCVFNDIAVGAILVNESGKKVMVVDTDLHQGNGTASIFSGNTDVFTFSIHQQNNYPIQKEISDLDIGLDDNVAGSVYNNKLADGLRKAKASFDADLIIYVAGSDAFQDDQLGGLDLTIEDLIERDRIIKKEAGKTPVVIVFAGGYARDKKDTVSIHSNSIMTFLENEK